MKLFVSRDLDGFFGLFIDNLVQLLLILALCSSMAGMSGDFAYLVDARILPGAAISIVLGNLFYSLQAYSLARRERRNDVTALPYGINTPSLLVYVFFVLVPLHDDPERAWRMGLVACFGSGVIELAGAFVAPWIRKHTPRAALLSTLSGIAIGFISMKFCLDIWSKPIVAMAPLAVVLVSYFSGVRFPFHLPGGMLAVLIGTVVAWTLPSSMTEVSLSTHAVVDAARAAQPRWPVWCGQELWIALRDPQSWLGYLSVIIPMGLFNLIGSLQNIESAEASGDKYSTTWSLSANGIGTIIAALLGSCFPTTIYIGHPGWKQLGARSGYSLLNGIAIAALCLSGTVPVVARIIPIEAGIGIVLWIGVIITAQAFSATPARHAPAVALGLFPAIAAWGATVALAVFDLPEVRKAGITLQQVLTSTDPNNVQLAGYGLHGLITMERGYIFVCMMLAALSAALIDRKFFVASIWCALGVIATTIGLTHAYALSGNVVDYLMVWEQILPIDSMLYRAYDIAAGYLAMALIFLTLGFFFETTHQKTSATFPPKDDLHF
ncbi:NCS2 family permease [bacterium]|nr:NCS2 family permease [bacterium]